MALECEKCGARLEVRGRNEHVCEPSNRTYVGCVDKEDQEEREAYDREVTNAVSAACQMFEGGWGPELAIAVCMERVKTVAEGYGWHRGYSIGRAYGRKSESPINERKNDDDDDATGTETVAACGTEETA